MWQLVLGGLAVFLAMIISEKLSQRKLISGELARKSTHVVMASTFAFLPFFIGVKLVAWLAVIDIFLALVARKLNLFVNARSVGRRTWGEFFFLGGTAISGFLTNSVWVFAAAMLILGLADAAAALFGKALGKHTYKVFGQIKSIEGSLAFILVTVFITLWFMAVAPADLAIGWATVFWLPLLAAGLEGLTPFGLDNLVLPIFVTLALGVW